MRLLPLLVLLLTGCPTTEVPAGPSASGTPAVRADSALAVLPRSAATDLSPCSRSAPEVEAGWAPTERDIERLEAALGGLETLQPEGCCGPERSLQDLGRGLDEYALQVVGVVVEGRRLLYLNAVPRRLDGVGSPDWARGLFDVCDGGVGFWGALYDPQARAFSGLSFNGEA